MGPIVVSGWSEHGPWHTVSAKAKEAKQFRLELNKKKKTKIMVQKHVHFKFHLAVKAQKQFGWKGTNWTLTVYWPETKDKRTILPEIVETVDPLGHTGRSVSCSLKVMSLMFGPLHMHQNFNVMTNLEKNRKFNLLLKRLKAPETNESHL